MSDDGFRFPLEKVLEWREELETERAATLAQALADERSARSVLEELRRLRDERGSRVADARCSGSSAVGHLQNLHLLVTQIESRLDEASTRHDEAREELEVSIAEYQGAHRDRKTLDHLRERRKDEWRVERGREDQKRTDEFSRNRRGLGDLVDEGDAS